MYKQSYFSAGWLTTPTPLFVFSVSGIHICSPQLLDDKLWDIIFIEYIKLSKWISECSLFTILVSWVIIIEANDSFRLFFKQFKKKLHLLWYSKQTGTIQITNLYSFQWCYKTIKYKIESFYSLTSGDGIIYFFHQFAFSLYNGKY